MPSIAAVSLSLLASAAAAGGQDDASFWSFLKPGTPLERCADGSKENDEARAATSRLHKMIDTLTETSDTAPALAAMRALLRTPCFHLASEAGEPPMPTHPLALKTWWDRGGDLWIWSYVQQPHESAPPNRPRRAVVVLPPEPQRVLFKETLASRIGGAGATDTTDATGAVGAAGAAGTHGDDKNEDADSSDAQKRPGVMAIACSQADAACGAETAGWMARARAALRADAGLDRRPKSPADFRPPDDRRERRDTANATERDEDSTDPAIACRRSGAGLSADRAYTTWRECIGQHRPQERTLPLGRTRAPREGWLILAGRRGHYAFCDEVRAYSLDTGAAYIARSCSGLALRSDGSVDAGRTNAHREESIRGGRLLADNLREALWMLILESQAYDTRLSADRYSIPPGMTVRYHAGGLAESGTIYGAGPGWSTAWTTLDWQWVRTNGEVVAHGEVTWPTSTEPAEAHAAALLDIAEKSLVSGCPPSPLPLPVLDAALAKRDRDDEAVKVMRNPARVTAALCGK